MVASRGQVDQPLTAMWPHFGKLTRLHVSAPDVPAIAQDVDVVFLALPHGTSQEAVASLFDADGAPISGAKVIDMSGDFRLSDPAVYTAHYKAPHTAAALLPRFVYGLSEWMREGIMASQHVANPGCFATAIGLTLAPLAARGLLPAQVTVVAATGSTGSGNKPAAGTHHPSRASNYKLYKVLSHQHVPEITGMLAQLGGETKLSFVPASAPMTHGIFATTVVQTDAPDALADAISAAYADAAFVRVTEGSPELNHVVGSNFADIGVMVGDRELVIACAIDNTIKGAAGQAIQNMNLMLGLPETSGLLLPPSLP